MGLKINLGCGRRPLPGFVNVDLRPGPQVDVVCDVETELTKHFEPDSVEHVVAIQLFEHVRDAIGFMRSLYVICQDGAKVEFATPYYTSRNAYEDPTHVRFLSENSWMYFGREIYEKNRKGDYGVDFDFKIESVNLIPYPEFREDPDIQQRVKHEWNIIEQMHTVLRVDKSWERRA
jgi:hypothetical protein